MDFSLELFVNMSYHSSVDLAFRKRVDSSLNFTALRIFTIEITIFFIYIHSNITIRYFEETSSFWATDFFDIMVILWYFHIIFTVIQTSAFNSLRHWISRISIMKCRFIARLFNTRKLIEIWKILLSGGLSIFTLICFIKTTEEFVLSRLTILSLVMIFMLPFIITLKLFNFDVEILSRFATIFLSFLLNSFFILWEQIVLVWSILDFETFTLN